MADAYAEPCTPSPPTRIQTPPAPRMGFLDSWDPYATPAPRKSARISSQRTAKRSSSPNAVNRQHLRPPASPKKVSTSSDALAMPSPQKKRQPAPDSVRRAAEIADNAHAPSASGHKKTARRSTVARTKDMLLTPSKTPRKMESQKNAPALGGVARELFSTESEELLTPRKRAKKYTGISMESFRAEEVDDPIDIFTDSQDRIPTKDESEENPFYGDVAMPEPTKRRSKRKVHIPGEGAQSVNDASRREDGMIYVFRGKKFFRKFSEDDPEEIDELQHDGSDNEEELDTEFTRPLRRSAIKPRLLFQTEKTPAMIEEEEAPTDVEDMDEEEAAEECPQTPVKSRQRADTPEAPKFAPVSPPDTKRTTRSMNKLLDEGTPMRKYNVRRSSTFDSWRRTKDKQASSAPKRAAETLEPATTKRTRT
ncbi:Fc.00g060680.m01.CDS01 [Cosmosporella sp. VM-42]